MAIRGNSYSSKPTLFIASSKEAGKIAGAVKRFYKNRLEVDIWYEDLFSQNKSFLDSLLNFSAFYDYAIVLLTADDKHIVRGEEYDVPRDNLLFELGLFLGRLGPNRAFALIEKKIKVLSDFQGVSVVSFTKTKDHDKDVRKACTAIGKEMAVAEKLYRFSLLPSTSLAIGYYQNFIRHVVAAFAEQRKITVYEENESYEKVNIQQINIANRKISLTILLPRNFAQLKSYGSVLQQRGYKKIFFNKEPRPFPFYIQGIVPKSGAIRFFDIPTTLLSSYETITELFEEDYLQSKGHFEKIEQREISNFEKTIRKLLPDRHENNIIKIEILQ